MSHPDNLKRTPNPAGQPASTTGSLAFVLFASAVTAIGGFLFGYDTAVINGANTYLQGYFGLDPQRDAMWIGLATAAAIYGCFPGALPVFGLALDGFGPIESPHPNLFIY